MITNITVKNVKGYDGSAKGCVDLELLPNKVTILVAPNGFGKSSLATAFSSLKNNKLLVEKEDKYQKNESLQSFLSIKLDGEELVADESKNDISKKILCCVVKSNLKAASTSRFMGNFSSTTSYLDIASITIKNTIPPKIKAYYRISEVKRKFGNNGKILKDLSEFFQKEDFLTCLIDCKDSFDKLCTKCRKQKIETIINEINSKKGTAEVIRSLSFDAALASILTDEVYAHILDCLSPFVFESGNLGKFLFLVQIFLSWSEIRSNLVDSLKRIRYEKEKRMLDEDLKLLSPAWRDIRSREINNSLVVEYPQANEISNGQRDVLTLVTELIKLKINMKQGKKYFILLDEVFDYLDDANTIAAQYYLSQFVSKRTDDVYVAILTHLDPKYFRSYIFGEKILKTQYLKKTQAVATLGMKTFIAYRESLNKDNPGELLLYNKLSKYLFHYNPTEVDLSEEVNCTKSGFKKTYGKTRVLKNFLIEEINKYFNDCDDYDPYAVALALRLKIEKDMYEKIDEPFREDFLQTYKTIDKLAFCEEHGVLVPDVCYVVSAIHNDSDHLKFNPRNPEEFLEKNMVYKLQNNVIRQVLKELFKFSEGSTILVDSIM